MSLYNRCVSCFFVNLLNTHAHAHTHTYIYIKLYYTTDNVYYSFQISMMNSLHIRIDYHKKLS